MQKTISNFNQVNPFQNTVKGLSVIAIMVVFVVSLLMLTGCGSNKLTSEELVGKWEWESNNSSALIDMTFYGDNTYNFEVYYDGALDKSDYGTWNNDGSTITRSVTAGEVQFLKECGVNETHSQYNIVKDGNNSISTSFADGKIVLKKK